MKQEAPYVVFGMGIIDSKAIGDKNSIVSLARIKRKSKNDLLIPMTQIKSNNIEKTRKLLHDAIDNCLAVFTGK
jgi:hypothetical protein